MDGLTLFFFFFFLFFSFSDKLFLSDRICSVANWCSVRTRMAYNIFGTDQDSCY